MRSPRGSRVDQIHGVTLHSTTPPSVFISLFVTSEIFRAASLFSLSALLTLTPIAQLACMTSAMSAVVLMPLQKALSNGPPLRKVDIRNLVKHSMLAMLQTGLFMLGLGFCGPMRALLLADHCDWALFGIAAVWNHNGTLPVFQVRSALIGVAAFLILLVFDRPSGHSFDHIETRHGDDESEEYHTVRHGQYFQFLAIEDRIVGILALVLAGCVRILQQNYGRKLGAKIGGLKRLNALTTLCCACGWLPLALLEYNGVGYWHSPHAEPHPIHYTGSLMFYVMFGMVVSFYVKKIVASRLNFHFLQSMSLGALMFGCELLQQWNSDTSIKFPTWISIYLILVGQYQWNRSKSLGIKGDSSKGSLIGYTPNGIPLYSLTQPGLQAKSFLKTIPMLLKKVSDNVDTRWIFYFLCVTCGFMLIEFTYGVYSNSLGLISDAFHMLFDCTALIVGLGASIASKWKATKNFPYGHGRVEILSGFTNSVLLVLFGVYIIFEALCRLTSPPEIHTERLFLVSVAGFVVNLFGIYVFSNGSVRVGNQSIIHRFSLSSKLKMRIPITPKGGFKHQQRGRGNATPMANAVLTTPLLNKKPSLTTPHYNTPDVESNTGSVNNQQAKTHIDYNLQGVYLHILADTLGSTGSIFSSLLVEHFGWPILDPVLSLIVAFMIVAKALPLLTSTTMILLDRVPLSLRPSLLADTLEKVKQLEGVTGCGEIRVWTHEGQSMIGTLHVIVLPHSNEQRILNQVLTLFKDTGITNLTIQIESQGTRSARPVMSALSIP
eukprot:m.92017 g.92017  ORF g.92017 m.92017 type:complete len:776 (+) comp26517_c0_seq2:141-2468(+)